jgi:hypothetical protein
MITSLNNFDQMIVLIPRPQNIYRA